MLQYRNKRTGAVIDVTYPVGGGDWEPVKAPASAPAAKDDAPVADAPAGAASSVKKAPAKKPAAKKPASKSGKKK